MSARVHAHATMSDFYPNPGVNKGVVRFFFDDDEFMSNVSVTVYNTFGTQIGARTTHKRGHFNLRGLENVGHLIARYDATIFRFTLLPKTARVFRMPNWGNCCTALSCGGGGLEYIHLLSPAGYSYCRWLSSS